jgi:acetylornithine deacetylase/succinyl-diaminopimelate desuccinylase-like protein
MNESSVESIIAYINANRQRYLDELIEIVKIPSISCESEHQDDVKRCADYLRRKMLDIGFTHAEVLPTGGHPAVYGEWLKAEGKPTVLVYGHYDVQPVEPLSEWQTPPFEPAIRGDAMYGRGTTDDKGQVYIHLKAVEAWLKNTGSVPVNVKFIIEGEEEVGSVHLEDFMNANADRLQADLAIISDTTMLDRGVPSICYGLRGLTYMEVEVRGPRVDLHSGSFGGAVANPANVLCEMVSKLKGPNGRVKIPGFYDKVRRLSPQERNQLRELPFNEEDFLRMTGSPMFTGERGFTALERIWTRPTLDVNGLVSGHTGEGSKTIIPSKALAKISMRLVPDQEPNEIAELFEQYVREIAPPTVTVEVRNLGGGNAFLAPYDHPAFQAAIRSLEKAFGKKAVFIREGGSIPFVATIYEVLKCPCILLGFGLPDENSHAPNEWLSLENYHQGIVSAAYFLDELAHLGAAVG